MIQSLLRRLFAPEPARLDASDAPLALAALLVRLARSDGDYAQAEIARIDAVLRERHGLSAADAASLRAEAEALESEAPDTVRFTRALKEATSIEMRGDLMEGLWSVALADGARDDDEDRLLRMVANLLGLTDVENAQARQRAARRI